MKRLPSIERIVERRLNAGIAGAAEAELYLKGDLCDDDYDDAYKQHLLDELERSKHETVVQTEFTLVFRSGVPVPALKKLGPRLKAFAEKQTGHPVTVYDPYRPGDPLLTPSKGKVKRP